MDHYVEKNVNIRDFVRKSNNKKLSIITFEQVNQILFSLFCLDNNLEQRLEQHHVICLRLRSCVNSGAGSSFH